MLALRLRGTALQGARHGALSATIILAAVLAASTGAAAQDESWATFHPEFPNTKSMGELPRLVGTFVLPDTPINRLNPWLDLEAVPDAVPDGAGGTINYRVNPAICSGLHYGGVEKVAPGDDTYVVGNESRYRHVFFGLIDIGVSEDCANNADGRFLAFPEYAATMAKFTLDDMTGDIVIEHVLPLLSSPGVHTISRDPRFTGQIYTGFDFSTGTCSNPVPTPSLSLGVKPEDALDSEDLYRFRAPKPGRATYLMAEEFGPSVFVTDEAGRVMKSFTHPADADTLDTSFDTVAIFPDVLTRARRGRGFESLAVSADEKFAWTILQSSLQRSGTGSDVLRAYKMDISDPLNIVVVGEFLYRFESLGVWQVIDPTVDANNDLKVSAVEWVAPDRLLVAERANVDGLLVFLADFRRATNVLGTPESLLTSPLIESRIQELGLRSAGKELRFDLRDVPEIGAVAKMEGLRAVTRSTLVMCEDADFAMPTRLWVVQLPRNLPSGDAGDGNGR